MLADQAQWMTVAPSIYDLAPRENKLYSTQPDQFYKEKTCEKNRGPF